MKKITRIPQLVILLTTLAVASGCASTSEEAPSPSKPAATAPPPQPAPASVPATPASAAAGQYQVVRGDNLWDISAQPAIYGNPFEWPLIYRANQDQIKDADLIYPGQVLRIDTSPSAADVDAAVRHARTRGRWSVGVVEESDRAYLAR